MLSQFSLLCHVQRIILFEGDSQILVRVPKAQIMYEMVILTSRFEDFEFPALFYFCPTKSAGNSIQKFQNVKKVQEIRIQKSPNVKKVQENSKFPNTVASITGFFLHFLCFTCLKNKNFICRVSYHQYTFNIYETHTVVITFIFI